MKKILMLLFIGIFFISFASAFEFDNTLTYSKENKVVLIENLFGLPLIGTDIAKIEIISHKDLSKPVYAIPNQYNRVIIQKINGMEDYNNFIGEPTFLNKDTNKYEELDYFWQKAIYGLVDVNDYKQVCSLINNFSSCKNVLIGSHKENQIISWENFTEFNIKKGENLTIALSVWVNENDWYDGIPVFFGKKISAWAEWDSGLDNGLLSYWKLNNDFLDFLENNDGTNSGTTDIAGIIGRGRDFEESEDDYIDVGAGALAFTDGPMSINMWVKPETITSDRAMFEGDENFAYSFHIQSGTKLGFGRVGTSDVVGADVLGTGFWQMITVTYDGIANEVVFYINGTADSGGAKAYSTTFVGSLAYRIGNGKQSSHAWDGGIDEVGIWEKVLSQAEITQLYNGGIGITPAEEPTISVNIINPIPTIYNINIHDLNSTYETTNGGVCDSIWYSLNLGIDNSTRQNCGTNWSSLTASEGSNTWTVYGNLTTGTMANDTVTFTINTTPMIAYSGVTPIDYTNQTFNTFKVNITTTETYFKNITFNLYNSSYNLINSTIFTDSTREINWTLPYENTFNYNVTVWTTTNQQNSTATRNINFHSTPPVINISSPNGTINFIKIGNNLTLSWSIKETGQTLATHIHNCSYTYNSVQVNLNSSTCLEINSTEFLYVREVNNVSFTATDEFNFTSTNISFFSFKVIENSQTFFNETIEGNLEDFEANVTLGSSLSISSLKFFYASIETTGSKTLQGLDNILTKINFPIPNINGTTNLTFNWELTLSDSSVINLTSKTQQVFNLSIDDCSTFSNQILNFTMVNEESQLTLSNTNIDISTNIFDSSRLSHLTNISFNSTTNPISVCLNINLSQNVEYSMDTIVKYQATGFVIEYYNIVNFILTNSTTIQDITLFDLNSDDSTDFQLSFTGSDFLPVENALVNVDRQYISENVFKTVELPKTDFNGQTVLHLVRNDVVYNIRIIKDGVVLGNFENIIAFCDDFTIGDCNIELNAFDSVEEIFDYDSDLGIIFSNPEYDSDDNEITFDFISSDGTSRFVVMNVTRNDIFGNRTVCDTSLTATGGTLICSLDPDLEDTFLIITIFSDGQQVSLNTVKLDQSNYGDAGYLIFFLMTIGIIFMFSGSKNGILFGMFLSFAGGIGFGLTNTELIGVGAAGISLILILIIGIWKLNKNKQQ